MGEGKLYSKMPIILCKEPSPGHASPGFQLPIMGPYMPSVPLLPVGLEPFPQCQVFGSGNRSYSGCFMMERLGCLKHNLPSVNHINQLMCVCVTNALHSTYVELRGKPQVSSSPSTLFGGRASLCSCKLQAIWNEQGGSSKHL